MPSARIPSFSSCSVRVSWYTVVIVGAACGAANSQMMRHRSEGRIALRTSGGGVLDESHGLLLNVLDILFNCRRRAVAVQFSITGDVTRRGVQPNVRIQRRRILNMSIESPSSHAYPTTT